MKSICLSGETKLFGIFGDPIVHTLSPLMHNTSFQRLGLNALYMPFQVSEEHLQNAIEAIRALNMVGVNITIPFKTRVGRFLDKVVGDALLSGSVNTIHNNNGVLVGYSTDGSGLSYSLKHEAGWVAEGQSVLLLGAGGAATAVAFRLAQEGATKLNILARSIEKSKALSDLIYERLGYQAQYGTFDQAGIEETVRQYSLIINATPLGMAPDKIYTLPPILPEWTQPDAVLCDLIYNPLETRWLQRGKELGRRTLNGLGMLIYQGAEAFRIWTGLEMPVQEVKRVLLEEWNKKY